MIPATAPLPAPSTKHLDTLDHPIPRSDVVLRLAQRSASADSGNHRDSTGTTGTTLWLGAQVMACYLADILPSSASPITTPGPTPSTTAKPKRGRALELGAGVGYLSLCLAYWGYEVISTDIEPVLSSVLKPNLELHRGGGAFWDRGAVDSLALDWVGISESGALPASLCKGPGGGFDFIVTTDTLYAPSLVTPLWTTLRLFSLRQPSPPPVYIALENRDPALIDAALAKGRELGFELKRIANRRVEKAVEKANWGWKRADWEGVEIWKARYKP